MKVKTLIAAAALVFTSCQQDKKPAADVPVRYTLDQIDSATTAGFTAGVKYAVDSFNSVNGLAGDTTLDPGIFFPVDTTPARDTLKQRAYNPE